MAYAAGAGVLVGLVDAHAVAEQPVTADVAKADLLLDQGQRLLVVAPQSEFEAAGPDETRSHLAVAG